MRQIAWAAFAAALLVASPAIAGPGDKDDGDDSSKFFMFYGEGQTAEVVRADLTYCMALAGRAGPAPKGTRYSVAMGGGLLGGIMDAIAMGVEQRRRRDSSMRTCMGAHGYSRYYVPESEWNPMVRGEGAVDRMVAYMTGPVPVTKKLPQ
jgi:hypothetical protein